MNPLNTQTSRAGQRTVPPFPLGEGLGEGRSFLTQAPSAYRPGSPSHAAALCVALGLSVAAFAYEWKNLGPDPIVDGIDLYTGRVSAVACSRTDPNRYFIAGADGGVWRTTDGGQTWQPLTDTMPASAMGALALDPTNENVIYAGTGEANYANHSRYGVGLYKSTDGGDTWVQLAESTFGGRCFARIVVSPQNPQRLYAAIGRAGGFPALAAAKGHPSANGPVGVFRSDDGGVTWSQLTGGLPTVAATDLAINPANPSVLYAAIGHIFGDPANGIYRSADGGDSWTKLAGGLPTGNLGRISLAIAPSQPARVYALITNAATSTGGNASTLGAYRTDNDGTTWTSLPVGSIQSTYGWYLSVVGVQPTNPDVVFMGGLNLYRSTNAGASWQNASPSHVDQHALDWDAAGRLVAGHDGGVDRTTNLGSTWTSLNPGLGLLQFYAGLSTHPTDDRILLGGTQDNGSNIRRAESSSWNSVLGGDGGWTQIDQVNPLRMFVEYQGSGNLYQSTNGGYGFNYSGSGISTGDRNCFLPPYLIHPTNSNRMLYATHRIYRSDNGGSSWTAISGDLTGGSGAVRTLAQSVVDPNVVYAATNDGRVLRSDNGGVSFTVLLTGVPGWPRTTREIFIDPTNPMTVYLAVASYGYPQVQRSTDGGSQWEILVGDLPDLPVNTIAVDVRGKFPVLYVGTDDGLYRSLLDGTTWHRYGPGLPTAAVIDLLIQPERGRLIAATQGRGAWQAPIAIPGDLNGDGRVDFGDINPFVLAMTNPAAYAQQYPTLDRDVSGDLNGDGRLDFGDINPFVALLVH